jgi:hypothetical protein
VSAVAAIAGKRIAEADAGKPPAFVPIGKPSAAIGKPKEASAPIVSAKTAAVTQNTGPVQKTWLIKLQSRRRLIVKGYSRSAPMAFRFNPQAGDTVIFAADGGSF